MFRVFFLISLLTVACNDTKKKKSTESGLDNVVPELKSELEMYHPPCGTGDPVAFTCPAGDEEEVWIDSVATPKCSELGLAKGDKCNKENLKCMDKAAIKCKTSGQHASSPLYLLCLKDEPEVGLGGCPRSRAETKNEIAYLNDAKKNQLASEILSVKLATYNYKPGYGDGLVGKQLGFIINDNPDSIMVMDGQRVNLYAYISAVVATVQSQQQKIEALELELRLLKKK